MVCLFIGFFVSALLVSQFSAKMVRVQTLNHNNLQQVELVRNFLVQQGVPPLLGYEVQTKIKERMATTKPLVERDIAALDMLPSSLRYELSVCIHGRYLLRNTVFFVWCANDAELVGVISSRASELQSFLKDEEVFRPLDDASQMFNVVTGECTYKRLRSRQSGNQSHALDDAAFVTTITTGAWASTAALWCVWTYHGSLRADRTVEFVVVKVPALVDVLSRRQSKMSRVMSRYAQAFAFLVTSDECFDVADLDIPPARVLMAMQLEDRLPICMTILDSLAHDQARSSTAYHREVKPEQCILVAQEIERGKAVMTLDPLGMPLRAVIVVTVRVTLPSGKILMRIGSLGNDKDDSTLTPDVCLPGTKVRSKECLRKAAFRTVQSIFGEDVISELVFKSTSYVEEELRSKKHGMKTRYMKTIVHMELDGVRFPNQYSSDDNQSHVCTLTSDRPHRRGGNGAFGRGPRRSLQTVPAKLKARRGSHLSHLWAPPTSSSRESFRIEVEPFLVARDDGEKREVYAWIDETMVQALSEAPYEDKVNVLRSVIEVPNVLIPSSAADDPSVPEDWVHQIMDSLIESDNSSLPAPSVHPSSRASPAPAPRVPGSTREVCVRFCSEERPDTEQKL